MLAGHTTLGASKSSTVTLKAQPAWFPAPSVAVQFTVVVPVRNCEPAGGLQTTVAPLQLSRAVTAKSTACAHWPGAVLVSSFSGQTITGGWMSPTFTFFEHERMQPLEFTTVNCTVKKPDAPASTTHTC